MTLLKRTLLYISRNKGKSILLFLMICLIVMSVILGGGIKSSADYAAKDVKKSLGSSFYIELANIDISNMFADTNGDGYEEFTGDILSQDAIDEIMQIDGISAYNAEKEIFMDTGLKLYPGVMAGMLEIYESGESGLSEEEIEAESVVHEIWKRCVFFTAVNDTSLYEFFSMGALDIIDGRHIKPDDTGAVVISEYVANENGLKVGDVFYPESNEVSLTAGGDPDTKVAGGTPVEIVGIYRINFGYEPSQFSGEYEILENMMFVDFAKAEEWRKDILAYQNKEYVPGRWNFDRLTFFVEDPAKLNSIVSKVRDLESINWNLYDIIKQTDTADGITAPLNSLSSMATTVMILIVAGGVLIMFLVMRMWAKTRQKETGIFLAVGMQKKEIVLQRLFEMLFIAVIAVIVGIVLSFALASPISSAIHADAEAQAAQTEAFVFEYQTSGGSQSGPKITQASESLPEDFNVSIAFADVAVGVLVGIGVSVAFVFISSIGVFKKKPKDLLNEH